jgi:hypothetical protein
MKLSVDQIAAAKAVLGAEPLPEDHPAVPKLQEAFGDRTFYVDTNGLLVFEPEADAPAGGTEARLILVAAWTDEERSALGMVEPVDTGVKVDLGEAGGGTGNGPA